MPAPLRVLHTETSPSLGGQELRILLEMEGLAAHNIESVLVARPEAQILAEALRRGLLAYPVPMGSNLSPPSMLAIARLVRRHRIDVVNAHNSKDAWNVAPVARVFGIPVVRSRHIGPRIRSGWWKGLPYGPLCDLVLTTSESIKKGLIESGVAARKIEVVPTGIDINRYQLQRNGKFRQEWNIPPGASLIGQIAVVRNDKGPDIFVRAAQHLLAQGLDAYFVLVGTGRMRPEVEAMLRPEERARIILTGFRRDIPEIFSELDLFVLAARHPEGVPQAILQAHAAHVPIVATTVGGVSEVAIGGENALSVPPDDPERLAEGIARLLADAQLAGELSSRGFEMVARQYSLDKMLDKMEQLYRKLAHE